MNIQWNPFRDLFNDPLFNNISAQHRAMLENDPFFQSYFSSINRRQNESSPHIEILDEEEEPSLVRGGRSRTQISSQPIENSDPIITDYEPSNEDKELHEAIFRSLNEAKQGQGQQNTSNSTAIPISPTTSPNGSDGYIVEEIEDDLPIHETMKPSAYSEPNDRLAASDDDEIQKILHQSAEYHKREQERLLREQQELEYAESLRLDQEKEKSRLEKKDTELEQQMREENEELLAAMQLSEDLSRKQKMTKQLKPEPAATEQNITQLVFRLPNGDKLQRRFYQNEKVEVLFKFLESRMEEQIPKNFELIINYPRKVFSKTMKIDLNLTLLEAQLVPQAVIFIREIVQ